MKTRNSFYTAMLILFSLCATNVSFAQEKITAEWEGIFMNDFKVVLSFTQNTGNLAGTIKMYAGTDEIQNDQLSNIHFAQQACSFEIPAKQTKFNGVLNDDQTELSGMFIFPDGSEHPLIVSKVLSEEQQVLTMDSHLLSAKDCREDLSYLFGLVKDTHPDFNGSSSDVEFETRFNELMASIDDDQTLIDFYIKASQLTDAVHCSHTGVRLPQTATGNQGSTRKTFPLKLFFLNGHAYSIDKTNLDIPVGSEILSINQQSIKKIIETVKYLIPANGYNSSTKEYYLNNDFSRLYPMMESASSYQIQYELNDIKYTALIEAISLEVPRDQPSVLDNLVNFEYLQNNSIAKLAIPTFQINDINQYVVKLDSIFNDLVLKNPKALVLDLRGNSGGHPIFAAQLFSYLTDNEFTYFKRNELIADFEPLYNPMQANQINYKGQIMVLVNGGCLSTTGHLISLLKFHTDAIFIGSEPGSTYKCNDFSTKKVLPHSGIEVNMPRTSFETAVSGFDESQPFPLNYQTNPSIIDQLRGIDRDIEVVYSMVNIAN